MKISLVSDFKIYDAGVDRNVSKILDELVVANGQPNIELDFCDCGVDYPATSKIIDKVLIDLATLPGDKNLTIYFDFIITDLLLHKWFFVGSTFFEIGEDNDINTNEEFLDKIKAKLSEHSISLKIEIVVGEGQNKILTYG